MLSSCYPAIVDPCFQRKCFCGFISTSVWKTLPCLFIINWGFFLTNHTLHLKENLDCEVYLYKCCWISVVYTVQSRRTFTEMQSFPAVKAFLFDSGIFLCTSSFPEQSLYLGSGTSKFHFTKGIYLLRWSLQ